MGSVRLGAHEVQPPLDMSQGMFAITAAYESLRATLRGRPDWSERDVIARLGELATATAELADGLQRRRDRHDQNLSPGKAAARMAANLFAACHG